MLSFLTNEKNSIATDTLKRVGLFVYLTGSSFHHEWRVYYRCSVCQGQREAKTLLCPVASSAGGTAWVMSPELVCALQFCVLYSDMALQRR